MFAISSKKHSASVRWQAQNKQGKKKMKKKKNGLSIEHVNCLWNLPQTVFRAGKYHVQKGLDGYMEEEERSAGLARQNES